jgi:hypothetical protein
MLAWAAPALGGCSLLLPWDELSGQGGTPDSGHTDASDAVSDGGYPEGSWCAMQPPGAVLCDDFDFETTAFERWSSHTFDIQGSAGFSTTAESPPYSFELKSGAITPNTYYVEVLQESVMPLAGTTSVSLSFAFQPAVSWDAGGGGEMYVATISQGPGAPRSDVWLEFGPMGTGLYEQITGTDGGVAFPPQSWSGTVPNTGHWTHVALQVDLAAATASVTLDGVMVGMLSLQGAWSTTALTNVYLGDSYLAATPAFDLLYDDAIIRQQ